MKVAVVGAGFGGLACAYELAKNGVEVDVFEKEKNVGGLASGFYEKEWISALEIFYHHIFENDKEIIDLAREVGLPAKFYNPETSSLIEESIWRLDSPISVIKFGKISILARLRMGLGLLLLKLIPNGLFLEKYTVKSFLPKLIGRDGYEKIWMRLLMAKFGKHFEEVNMAWFWSRVAKRTKRLGYFEGGFQALAEKIKSEAERRGVKFFLGQEMVDKDEYDKVVMTVPAPETDNQPKINYLWGQTLILILKKSLMRTYWLNILENNWPFLVAVEHTRMIDKRRYGNNHILYLGNYLTSDDERLKMDVDQLLELYWPYLKKINPAIKKSDVVKTKLYARPFSQPVFPVNYSKVLEKLPKKLGKYYFANMSMVYPFDRGTNYAVKMGQEVARKVMENAD